MRRVVITGIGAVTPLGLTFRDSCESLKRGISGVATCTKVDISDLPWKVSGEVKGFDPSLYLTKKEINRSDLFIQYALVAATEACDDASLKPPRNTAVLIGSSRGGIATLEKAVRESFTNKRRLSAYLMSATTITMAASAISNRFRLKGYALGLSSACASGAVAIGEAFRMIRDGATDVAIAGGTESPLCRLCLEGYGRMGVLSKGRDAQASRPFDRKRDGFVLSEGAAVVILEEMERAVKRGARIYAEVAGYATYTDGSVQTGSTVQAEAKTMRDAMAHAGLREADIDLINAHATATQVGDRVEAEAIEAVFGRYLQDIPVTANKSLTGHMLAASGAFELAVTAMAVFKGEIPPTINLDDPEFGLNIPVSLMKREINVAITNSFGFGGVNASLLLKKV